MVLLLFLIVAVWKFTIMECGAQCVMMVSVPLMLQLLADNLAILITADMEVLQPLGRDLF